MRVLFDTNIILDILLDRLPHAKVASALVSRVERGELVGYLCATTLTTIFYLSTKTIGKTVTHRHIKKLLELFEIALVNRSVLECALTLGFNDFEDAVLYEAARHVEAECIVTRNIKDFKSANIPIYLPNELEAILNTPNL